MHGKNTEEWDTSCLRIDHLEGYIELRFSNSSKQAIDEIICHLQDIAQQSRTQPDTLPTPIRIFANSTDLRENVSTQYLLNRIFRHYNDIIMGKPTRLAALFHNTLLMHVANRLVKLPDTNIIAFRGFSKGQVEEAVQWLLCDEP